MNDSKRKVGAHVSASGGLQNAITNGQALGVNSIQTMFTAPMRWSTKEIPTEQVVAMAEEQVKEGSVTEILFHGIYLINLARQDKQMFHLSKLSLQTHIEAATRLEQELSDRNSNANVLGVTFHVGSAKDSTLEEGLKRASQGLNWVIDKVPDGAQILLEVSAGAGNIMGAKIEQLAEIREGVEAKDRIEFVLDTQHMFASGYDWKNDLEGILKNLESVLTLERVKAIHLNDSLTELASNKDRHANLGEGLIGEEAMKAIINHPKLKDIPMILETPALKAFSTAKVESDKLQSWAK